MGCTQRENIKITHCFIYSVYCLYLCLFSIIIIAFVVISTDVLTGWFVWWYGAVSTCTLSPTVSLSTCHWLISWLSSSACLHPSLKMSPRRGLLVASCASSSNMFRSTFYTLTLFLTLSHFNCYLSKS